MSDLFLYYRRDGSPMPRSEWQETMTTNRALMRVRDSRLWLGLVTVSTIWTGIDHDNNYLNGLEEPNPRPLIFETMVFIGSQEVETIRAKREKDAIVVHKSLVLDYLNPRHVFQKTPNKRKLLKSVLFCLVPIWFMAGIVGLQEIVDLLDHRLNWFNTFTHIWVISASFFIILGGEHILQKLQDRRKARQK